MSALAQRMRLPRMTRALAPVLCAVLAWLALAGAALADFPPLTGRVVDAAHILDPATRAALDARLAAQEEKATDQLVVATVPSLEGTSIEDYANRLFRFWKLGQEKKNNGVLLLVAPNERKVRIEVGYGLEGILTDAVSSAIIRNAIVPSFKAGDMAGGVMKGADAILEILNLDPEEARVRARRAEQPPELSFDEWFNLIFLVILVAFWAYVFWRSTRGGGGPGAGMRQSRRRGDTMAGGPITTWDWGRGGGGWSGGGGGGWSGGGGSSGGGGASGGW